MQGNLNKIKQPAATSKCLPPGFRFHPTDEELITYYLARKIAGGSFSDDAITEVDLNKHEPWDLPGKTHMKGDREWYFFSVKDKKYPSGSRTNRATRAGYWKATGKDKEVFLKSSKSSHAHQLHTQGPVGMKKTLVFYEGRAPKGLKSNWVMHEYRLHDQYACIASSNNKQLGSNLRGTKEAWVLCRVLYKNKLQQLMRCRRSPPPTSKNLVYSSIKDDASHETNLLQANIYNTLVNNTNIVNYDWLPPLCNEHKEATKHAMASDTTRDDIVREGANLTLPLQDLATLPITISNSDDRILNFHSHQFNTMLSEELDSVLNSTPYTALPRFPSELESLWLQSSSSFFC